MKMKMIVNLVVLLAALLLLTGVAFASDGSSCACYKINFTDLDNPADSETDYEELCLDYVNHTGIFIGCDVSLFPGLITQGLIGGGCPCAGFFKFHGNDNNVITGDLYCEDRYDFWGHIAAESCTLPSDVTLKKDIEPLSSSLGKVMRLQGVSYDWKVDEYPDKGFTGDRQIGFIAQDVEKVFPELVRTDSKGYKSIYYAQMVAVLAEAIKEQQAMIGELTDKIAQLQKALEQKKNNMSASVK
jgi:hypothetical protein